jgi:hypothetical protein
MNLNLLAPAGLFAAISLGIVLLLHIRRQTPPPRSFPSLRFWTPSETSEADRHRIRRPPITLPLLLQLLVALLVTLALARPAVSDAFAAIGGRTSPQHRIVLVDGSTSMLAHNEDEQRSRWEHARQEALSIVDDWQAGDVTTIVLLGTTSETRSASNGEQIDELHEWMQEIAMPGGQADLNGTLRLVRNLGLSDRDNSITLITDTALQVDPEIASTVPMQIDVVDVSAGEPSGNVAITSMTAKPIPGTDNQFAVSLTIGNYSDTEADVPWFVEADGSEIATNTAFIPAGASAQMTVNLPRGVVEAKATIDFRDALYADNQAMLPLESDRLGQLDILLVSDAPSNLLRALQVLPGARVDLQPAAIPGIRDIAQGYDLVVFEGTSPPLSDLPETPMLFVQPPATTDLFAVIGATNAPAITTVDAADPLIAGVDLSGVTFGNTPVYSLGADEHVLVSGSDTVTNAPLIWSGEIEANRYVTFAFDIPGSNIGQRVAFPVLIARIVENLTAAPIPMSVPIGNPVEVATADDVTELEVTLPNQSVVNVPIQVTTEAESATNLPTIVDFTGTSGRYVVKSLRGDDSVADEGAFVVNAGHVQESNLAPNAGLADLLKSGTSSGSTSDAKTTNQNELWLALAAFAFVVMFIEWALSDGFLRRSSLTLRGARG